MPIEQSSRQRVVIIGGGFGGLYAARKLGTAPVDVTLIDCRNFHLFQPLLYQVATGGLSPGDIASPLRAVLHRYKNIHIIKSKVTDIEPKAQQIFSNDKVIPYDILILAAGMTHYYYGHQEWARVAPGLKEVEDALEIRRRIFNAFEEAEKSEDPDRQRELLTFV
ncbi:MAG: NAD(P)/FAD-dependent oxidoreductase, partial [Methanobacteriota archaeon]